MTWRAADRKNRLMMFRTFAKPAACLIASSALLFGGVAFASPASPLCGGGKKGVQKPKDGDEKKPANPASVEALCGGGKKDVKKPKDGDEKKPSNPA